MVKWITPCPFLPVLERIPTCSFFDFSGEPALRNRILHRFHPTGIASSSSFHYLFSPLTHSTPEITLTPPFCRPVTIADSLRTLLLSMRVESLATPVRKFNALCFFQPQSPPHLCRVHGSIPEDQVWRNLQCMRSFSSFSLLGSRPLSLFSPFALKTHDGDAPYFPLQMRMRLRDEF